MKKSIKKTLALMLPLLVFISVFAVGGTVFAEAQEVPDAGKDHYHYQGSREGVYTFSATTPVYDKPGSGKKIIAQMSDTIYPAGDNDIYYYGYKLIQTVDHVESASDGKMYGRIKYFESSQPGGQNGTYDPAYMKTGWVVLDERYGTKEHFKPKETPSGEDVHDMYYGGAGKLNTRMKGHPDIGKSVLEGKATIVEATYEYSKPAKGAYFENKYHNVGDEVEVQYTIWNHTIASSSYFQSNYENYSKNFPVGWCKLKNGRFVELSKIQFNDDFPKYISNKNNYETWQFVFHRQTMPDNYAHTKKVRFYLGLKNDQYAYEDKTIQTFGNTIGSEVKIYSRYYHEGEGNWYLQTDKGYIKVNNSNYMPDGSIRLTEYYLTTNGNIREDSDIFLYRTNICTNGTTKAAEYNSDGTWRKTGKSSYPGITVERTYKTYKDSSFDGFKLGPGDMYPTTTPYAGYLYLMDIVNEKWGRFQCYSSDMVYEKTIYLDLSKNLNAVVKQGSNDSQKVFGKAIVLESAEVGRPYTVKSMVEVHAEVKTQFGDVCSNGNTSQILGVIPTGKTVCVSNIRNMQGGTWGTVTLSDGRTGDVDMSYLETKKDNIQISAIDINSLNMYPDAGTTASADAVIDSSKNYEVYSQYWNQSGVTGAFEGKFEWGKAYEYHMFVVPKEGYAFGTDNTEIPVCLNGVQIGKGKVVNNSGNGMVRFSFTRTFDTIDSVSLTVYKPQTNSTINASFSAQDNSGFEIVEQGWKEGSSSGAYVTGRFKSSKDYYYCALLKPKAGLKFVGSEGSIISLMKKAVVVDKRTYREYDVNTCYKYSDNDSNKPGYVYVVIKFSTDKLDYASYVSVNGPTSPIAGALVNADATNAVTDSKYYIAEQYWVDDLNSWMNQGAVSQDTCFSAMKDYYHVTVIKLQDEYRFALNANNYIMSQVKLDNVELSQIEKDKILGVNLDGLIDGDGIFYGDEDQIVIIKRYTPVVDDTKKTGDCFWNYDSSTGTLTVFGNGDMGQYSDANDAPWFDEYKNIKNIIIADGVTCIGKYAFSYTQIGEITIPDSVNKICMGAFFWCTKLEKVNLGNGVTNISTAAFCTEAYRDRDAVLTSMTIPENITIIKPYAIGYKYIHMENVYEKIDGFTIYGACGSAAETYAAENEFTFVATHTSLTQVPAVAATTTSEGNKEYYTCSVCGKWFEDSAGTKEITDHSSVIIPKLEESKENGSGKTGNGGNASGNAGGNSGNGSTETPKNKLVTTDGKSQYYKEDGSIAKNEWVTINNIKYYFNADGYNASNEWRDGKWISADGSCTYEGELIWKSNSTGWWVEDSKGWYPVSSWQKIDGVWYYFTDSGYMASNEYYNGYWFNEDGSWDDHYFLTWKCNSTGWWVEDKSGWWPSSKWLKINGSWYYFDASGYMVTNQYVDGYWLGSDGACQ